MQRAELHVLTLRQGKPPSAEPFREKDMEQAFAILPDGRVRVSAGRGRYLEISKDQCQASSAAGTWNFVRSAPASMAFHLELACAGGVTKRLVAREGRVTMRAFGPGAQTTLADAASGDEGAWYIVPVANV